MSGYLTEVETLERAAALMRADEDRRWQHVGRWLDRVADFWEHPDAAAEGRPVDYDIALAAAHAYIGGAP